MNKRIILAAGHGGGDAGAVGQGTTEAAEVIKIVNLLADKLRRDGQLEVVVVPHELNLIDEIAWINERYKNLEDGLCIEVHKNAAVNAHGIEVWYWGGDAASMALANQLLSGIMTVPNMPVSRGVHPDDANRWGSLGWIRETNPWALLAEMGFVSDGGDPVDDVANDRYATGLLIGIMRIFGLQPTPQAPAPVPVPAAPAPAPAATVKYKVYDSTGKQLGAYNSDAGAWNKYQTGGAKIVDVATGSDVTGDFVNKYRVRTDVPTMPIDPTTMMTADAMQNQKLAAQGAQLADQQKQITALQLLVNAIIAFCKKIFKNFPGGKQ